jgi:hypothetical protein
MILSETVEAQGCRKQRREGEGIRSLRAKHQSEAAGRGEGLRGPVKLQPTMAEALRK